MTCETSVLQPTDCIPLTAVADGQDSGLILRKAFGCFPTGVVAVCGLADGHPVGMAASSFVPVSLDPALVAFCVQCSSNTWRKLEPAGRLGISVLGESHDIAARRLASRAQDKFDGLDVVTTPDGAVLIDGASVWLDCTIDSVVPAGDHAIVLLKVHALVTRAEIEPLVFHGSAFRVLEKVAV